MSLKYIWLILWIQKDSQILNLINTFVKETIRRWLVREFSPLSPVIHFQLWFRGFPYYPAPQVLCNFHIIPNPNRCLKCFGAENCNFYSFPGRSLKCLLNDY